MNALSDIIIAPLVRGLFLDAAGRPVVVRRLDAAEGGRGSPVAPASTARASASSAKKMVLELSSASVSADGSLDEASAARELASSFAMAGSATLPAIVEVRLGGEASLAFGVEDSAVASPAADAEGSNNSARDRSRVVEGRIALVTGGAQGFGAEIVRGLAASGAYVYVADMNLEGSEKLAAELNAGAGREIARAVGVNVTDEASVAAMFDSVARATGGLDLIVSNAGVVKAGSVLEQDEKSFRFVTDVNYVGFFLMTKHGGRLLRRQRRTAPRWMTDIVQVNSKSGLEGSNKNGAYAGSKFGGLGLVQSFALELVQHGIKVNAICPGNFLDGPLWSDPKRGLFVQYLESGKVPGAKTVADVRAYYESKVPMGRGATGADVMRALYYLVEQEYETGQALPVTGGQVMLK